MSPISMNRLRCCGAAAIMLLAWMPQTSRAADLVEPPVFASKDGVLDLLMIAKAAPVPGIAYVAPRGITVHPTGWIYEICRRAAAHGPNECPADAATVADYGGVRLALQPGDKLKIRLVNRLPKLDPVKVTHSADPGGENLPLNLTNLHTHGMIVPARAPTLADPTFGDDVFVEIYNSANGVPVPQTTHQHGSLVKDFVDYRIDVPANHPSGSFWFHPHVHGLALNQVSAGLSGIISVGSAGDYASGDLFHAPFPDAQVRHLILKDMQVMAHGTVQFDNGPAKVAAGEVLYQEDPGFCSLLPAKPAEKRQGSCPGADNSPDDAYAGGRWFFTVNGETFPTIKVHEPDGELWRLTNASGSASYDLQLVDDTTHKPMIMQLVSVDGVSIDVPVGTALETAMQMGGARFKVVACPPQPLLHLHSAPVCVTEFAMMPSSRAEVWVTYRDEAGRIGPSPKGATATFKTVGLTTGPAGDAWPAVDLATVAFDQSGPRRLADFALDIRGDALAANQDNGIFHKPVPGAVSMPVAAQCKPLPEGHRRRIFFGLADPANDSGSFGLGYEEVDAHGVVVPGTRLAVRRFDPSQNIICVPLGPGQTPAHETWELVNLATENHNFHIHQTKFRFVGTAEAGQAGGKERGGIMEDNVPLPVAVPKAGEIADKQNGYCTVAQWHSGECSSVAQVVEIPFSQLGEFVYHCHILEHEDGGMMARIRVVPAPLVN